MPISWLQGALLTQKILIIRILGKLMKRIIDGIWSLSMKWIIAFTMKSTCQLPVRLIRRPHFLQWQQQLSQKMIPWWVQSSTNQPNKNWGEPASEKVTKVISIAFKETFSEPALEYLFTKVTQLETCKYAQAKLVSRVLFTSVAVSIRSTDMKLQEIQC